MRGGLSLIDDTDFLLLQAIGKWRFLLSRHLILLSPLSERTTYRRLKLLEKAKYLKHERVLYGVPALYTLTHKGKMLIGLNKRDSKFRIEQIEHDILCVDMAFHFMKRFQLSISDITGEKELHSLRGFGSRQHVPDLTFTYAQKTFAVEVELSLKAKETLRKNTELNFMNYDNQIWIIRKKNTTLLSRLGDLTTWYPNIQIEYLEELTPNE